MQKFIFLVFLSGALQAFAQLRPIQYDGCTLFAEGTVTDPLKWDHCCFEHDVHYWAGGSKERRLEADRQIRHCFREVGEVALAEVVYAAIRAGSLYPFPFRGQQWGNAWNRARNYRCLTADDLYLITEHIKQYDISASIQRRILSGLERDVFRVEKKCK